MASRRQTERKYRDIFLSHRSINKPFVRRFAADIAAERHQNRQLLCGDFSCNGVETCNPHSANHCFFDCGSCPTCGDGFCDYPETCRSSVLGTGCCDCGECTIFDSCP